MKSLFYIVYFKTFFSKLLNVSDQFESLCESEKHNRKHIISNYVILNILKVYMLNCLSTFVYSTRSNHKFCCLFLYNKQAFLCVLVCVETEIFSSSLACGWQQLIIYVQRIYDIKLIIFFSFLTLVHQKTCIGNQIRNKKNRFIAWHRNGEAIHMTACYE